MLGLRVIFISGLHLYDHGLGFNSFVSFNAHFVTWIISFLGGLVQLFMSKRLLSMASNPEVYAKSWTLLHILVMLLLGFAVCAFFGLKYLK